MMKVLKYKHWASVALCRRGNQTAPRCWIGNDEVVNSWRKARKYLAGMCLKGEWKWTADEVSKHVSCQAKPSCAEETGISTAITCLLAVCLPVFKRHELDIGLLKEHRRSCGSTYKGNDQSRKHQQTELYESKRERGLYWVAAGSRTAS